YRWVRIRDWRRRCQVTQPFDPRSGMPRGSSSVPTTGVWTTGWSFVKPSHVPKPVRPSRPGSPAGAAWRRTWRRSWTIPSPARRKSTPRRADSDAGRRPDGYGEYRRDRRIYEFYLEYDRGTTSRRD